MSDFFMKNVYFLIIKTLNNREMALGIWIIILIVYLLIKKSTRGYLINVIKIVFCAKFDVIYLFMLIYLATIIYVLYLSGIWDKNLLKDTIIWLFFTGIISLFKSTEAKDFEYFKAKIKDYIKVTLIVEFIANSYTFSLFWELLLVPIITILTICTVYSNNSIDFQDKKYNLAKNTFKFLNVFLGIYILFSSILLAVSDFDNISIVDSMKRLILSPILSIAFLGFIYFFALFCKYEEIFVRIPFGEKKSKSLILYIKFKIITHCYINIKKVSEF